MALDGWTEGKMDGRKDGWTDMEKTIFIRLWWGITMPVCVYMSVSPAGK